MKYFSICSSWILLAAFIFCGSGQQVHSQITLTLQPDAATGQDARIWNLDPSSNAGTVEDFIAAYWTWGGTPGILRSLIRFDLSSIPADAYIKSAKLSLYYNPTSPANGQEGNNASWIQRITAAWDESTVTWNNQPATTTAGEVSLPQSTTIDQDYPDINVKQMVKYQVSHPAQNFGFMLRLQDETAIYSSVKFASSDYSTASLRPKLVIVYDTIAPPADSSTCITIRPDAAAGIDARIWNLDAGTNAGSVEDFIAAYWTWGGTPGLLRSLIQFDLSSIPSNATVSSAKLSLYYNPTSPANGQEGSNASWLQRITSSWTENGVTWNNQPATTTSGQVALPQSTTIDQDYPNNNLKQMVKFWVAHPTQNYGCMLRLQDETVIYSSMKFASSDYSDATRRPKLNVCYTTNELNGETKYHEDEFDANRIIAYPNPFNDELIISLDQPVNSPATLLLLSADGKTIVPPTLVSIENGGSINIGALIRDVAPGVYFLKVKTDGEAFVKKLVKE